ncbi:sulfite exporter TauE/SafE family protein [Caproiciproducens galactitolivorans]|uniref:Probable membrane transporter protein n=1 Tax=Caproiciproducens galactitolivorans TaxID=642589 RepID=A0ABT4BVU1_9FIRM|nr:sulfite exporter TauE/SafE family protein [Caproiciproducens galactitolivorans]MCY1714445.1 sulfite exporter TauE/SafE family protein [Caproiciproducens galactitolivorans]
MEALYFMVSFIASVAGAICGIGGGVIIKPVLDCFHIASVSTISFLSSCTVLSMSFYSVGRSFIARDSKVDAAIGTPLAVGAASGGLLGKYLFGCMKALSHNAETVGAAQSICLAIITLGTLIYTIYKDRIPTMRLNNKTACVVIGLFLGVMSSFLGIGGGPINLVVLFFFFSMDTKTAAQNSLYIILVSQIFSIIFTLMTHTVPDFDPLSLTVMVFGGIAGGVLGRILNKRINNKTVNNLFLALMGIIIFISGYNIYRFLTI